MESLIQFGLRELTTEQFDGRRCTSCSHLQEQPVAGCALRALAVPRPDASCCAAHSDWNPQARAAYGPVFDLRGACAVRAIPPGESRSERDELLRVLDSVDVRVAEALSLPQRVAIAEALSGEDRRCFAPLDRIAARFEAAAAPPSAPLGARVHAFVGQEFHPSGSQKAGLVVFGAACVVPALMVNGFGPGRPIALELALVISSVGGAVGGALVCPRPLVAGLAGGLLAGTGALLGVYFYTLARTTVWNVELALVQAAASVPGLVLGLALKKLFAPAARAVEQFAGPGGKDPNQPTGQA